MASGFSTWNDCAILLAFRSNTPKPQPRRFLTGVPDQFGVAYRRIGHLEFPALENQALVLIADQCADVEKCETAIPVIKYIAREMIKNEIAADPQMNAPPALKTEH
jgi:hypothetical protein